MKPLHRVQDAALRWRHRWSFHFAHHALCDRFRSDVLRLGRLHLCRSCTALAFGIGTMTLVLLALEPNGDRLALGVRLGLVPVFFLGHPSIHRRLPRALRDLGRGLLGAWLAALLFLGPWAGPTSLALHILPVLVLAIPLVRRRRLAKADACRGCSELESPGVCSGYKLQAEALGRWEEAQSARLAMRRGL